MSLIRKYKISKILNRPLICVEGEIISFIKMWLKDLISFKDSKNDDVYYMTKSGKFVLKYMKGNNSIFLRRMDFYDVLTDKYKEQFFNGDISSIIRFMIHEYLGMEYNHLYSLTDEDIPQIEVELKYKHNEFIKEIQN